MLEGVGVVGNVHLPLADANWSPTFYTPMEQGVMDFDATDLVRTLEAAITSADPHAVPVNQRLMSDGIGELLYPRRVAATTLALAGAIGLVLASTGLYGLVSYSAAQRVREIGVRMALGADRGDVLRLIFRSSIVSLIAERQRRFDRDEQPVARDVPRIGVSEERVAALGANARQTVDRLFDLAAAPTDDVAVQGHLANARRPVTRVRRDSLARTWRSVRPFQFREPDAGCSTMLAGFRLRWTTPFSCAASRASATWPWRVRLHSSIRCRAAPKLRHRKRRW